MWKLLTLLCAGMFLVLLIGGEDRGQQRMGLRGVEPAAPPAPVAVAVAVAPRPDPAPQRVALRAPEPAPEPVQPEVAVAASTPAERPVFSLSSFAPVQPDRQPPAPPLDSAPVVIAEPAAAAPAPEPAALPLRWVQSASINVRGGPSTADPVIGNLKRGEAVAVVAEAGDGWLLVRIEGDGVEGYVAARLLTDQDPG